MTFVVSSINGSSVDTPNVRAYINVPSIDHGSGFNVYLTGPVTSEVAGVTISYSTVAVDTDSATEPTNVTWLTADEVTDWSSIKSIRVQKDVVSQHTKLGRIVLHTTDPTLASDSGLLAYVTSITFADGFDKPIALSRDTGAAIAVAGVSIVHTKLQYVDTDGVTKTVDLKFKKRYVDNIDVMEKSDFPSSLSGFDAQDQATIKALLDQGYAIDTSEWPSDTLENGPVTWDQAAEVGQVNLTGTFANDLADSALDDGTVRYYYDGDSVIYKLVHAIKDSTEQKTITRTINVHKPDGSVETTKQPVTVTRNVKTDEVTGKKTYGSWTTGTWEQYNTPSVAGYTPTMREVDMSTVTADMSDVTVDIYYTADPNSSSTHKTPKHARPAGTSSVAPASRTPKHASVSVVQANASSNVQSEGLPKTGDESSAVILTALTGASAASFAAILALLARRRKRAK